MPTTVLTTFKLRGDTAANWTSANPVLAEREPGIETDTRKVKYGDGVTEWNSLPYAAVVAEAADIAFTPAGGLAAADVQAAIEELDGEKMGGTDPTDIAFSAGNFTASGSMTWTVGSGDVVSLAYAIVGKVMTIWFYLQATTVGGTPDRYLNIAVPASKSARNQVFGVYHYYEGSTWKRGFVSVAASGTVVRCEREDNSNWSATTDGTYLLGQLTFPIT